MQKILIVLAAASLCACAMPDATPSYYSAPTYYAPGPASYPTLPPLPRLTYGSGAATTSDRLDELEDRMDDAEDRIQENSDRLDEIEQERDDD